MTFIPSLTFTDYEWFPWSICNGCGMPAGNAYPSGHLVPHCGTCLCSNCWGPDSSNLPCLCSTFYLENPLVLSRFCSWIFCPTFSRYCRQTLYSYLHELFSFITVHLKIKIQYYHSLMLFTTNNYLFSSCSCFNRFSLWSEIARCVPFDMLGTAMGLANAVGGLCAGISGLLVGKLLNKLLSVHTNDPLKAWDQIMILLLGIQTVSVLAAIWLSHKNIKEVNIYHI